MAAHQNTLTPQMAAAIASNSYFTLKGWTRGSPVAGVEKRGIIRDQVLGAGAQSLRGTVAEQGRIKTVLRGNTGDDSVSGFGYVLNFRKNHERHTVIVARGTRPELMDRGIPPDLLTDARGSMTVFEDYGQVHHGFKETYDSLMRQLTARPALTRETDFLHVVGHSLGGGVATLLAGKLALGDIPVRLYTFGSPRVGIVGTQEALWRGIGKENVYRVAHDLDPVTLLAPYPYMHLAPQPGDTFNLTFRSPTGNLLSTDNHDMKSYVGTIGQLGWPDLVVSANSTDYQTEVLVKWLLYGEDSPSWIRRASVRTLSLLLQMFRVLLGRSISTMLVSTSAMDLLAEVLIKGYFRIKQLGDEVHRVLGFAAQWAGIAVKTGEEFTAEILRRILAAMLVSMRNITYRALTSPVVSPEMTSLVLAGMWSLTGGGPL